jgi:hypothetical protein
MGALDLLALDELGVTRRRGRSPAQHLAHDHFDVLVVDLDTLQTVDVLHLVGDVTASASTPSRRRMSCGSGAPSTIDSPLLTTCPS